MPELARLNAGYTPPQDALEKPRSYADFAPRYRTLLFFLCAGSNRCWVYTASRRCGKAAGLRRLRPALQDSPFLPMRSFYAALGLLRLKTLWKHRDATHTPPHAPGLRLNVPCTE